MKYRKHIYWNDDGSGDAVALMVPVYAEPPERLSFRGGEDHVLIQFDLDSDESEEVDEDEVI